MITKITSENDLEFYAPRFQEITEALAIETPETRNKMIEAVSSKINQYAYVEDPNYVNANTYLKEVISLKKARSANRDTLIDAFTAALVEHSNKSLMALYSNDIASGAMINELAQLLAQDACIPDTVIEELMPHVEEFAEAAILAYQTYGLVIDSLETYFSNLDDIKNLQTSQLERGKFLLVMPADEPYFEIDANARTIKVPDSFKKNGVGVYGDHFAELLTFKIDRYFDNQDFMNTKIAINWNFVPTGSKTPAFEEVQAQAAFAKDDELEPGYVVFGFFVTKDMTPSKGVLSFSVTCYNDANGEITYSFNTQTAQVTINDGLSLKDPTAVKSVSDEFLGRISSSSYTPEGISPIEDPIWELGALAEGSTPLNPIYLGLENELNFNIDENGVEDDTLEITTQAYAPGLNTMKYTWYITPVDGNAEPTPETARDADTITHPSDYFLTRDVAPQENSVYYIKDSNTGVIDPKPLPHQNLTVEQAFENTNIEVYELGSTYEAIGAGRYYVEALASKITGRPNGTYIKTTSNIIASNNCVVPAAVKPAVTIEVESALTPENTDFIIETDNGFKFVDAEHVPVINAVVTSTNENIPLGAIALEAIENSSVADLSADYIIANTYDETENPDGKYRFALPPASGAIQVSAEGVTEEGQYCVRAINRRNHTYSVSEPTEMVQTSFIAPKITDINVYTMEGSTRINLIANGDIPADATLDPNFPEDGAVVEFNPRHLSRTFVIDNNTTGLETYEEADRNFKVDYVVEELAKNGEGVNAEFTLQADDAGGEGADIIDVELDPDYEDAYHLEENKGAYTFTVYNDQGYYRIRTECRYHGTLRIGYSKVFKLTSAVSP